MSNPPSSIRILPPAIANKIAAGEVVQRPAAVVKELLENSIDAGATMVTISVKDGGSSFIQVTDNGSGIAGAEAALAFERHATSKIVTDEDLGNIRTLGFRGEALASIAAVAQVELKTRVPAAEVGTQIRISGGGRPESSPVAVPPGTSVTVRNLFFNTPGRRKFLKSTATEFRHVDEAVKRIAIANPLVHIRFFSDDEQLLDWTPADLRGRLSQCFGERVGTSLIRAVGEGTIGTLSGYLGRPEYARKGRTEQYLFLNNRYIVSRAINYAVVQAYEHLLEKGSFPLFVVSLTIDPHRVDVNVHPSKMEAKFEDDNALYRFVYGAVRKALAESNLVPAVRLDAASTWKSGMNFDHPSAIPTAAGPAGNVVLPTGSAPSFDAEGAMGGSGSFPVQSQSQPHPPAGTVASPWQLHGKYIIVPAENGMLIVDQHAAHERVLYERTIARFAEDHTQSQQLLFPHTLQLSPGDAALVAELMPILEKMGFGLRLFGGTTVILDGVPVDVRPGEEATILPDVLGLYKDDAQKVDLPPRERLAKSYSCKAAIKAGDPLKEAEMQSLLDQLFRTEVPFVCPHGRPVLIRFTLPELDKRFGRTS